MTYLTVDDAPSPLFEQKRTFLDGRGVRAVFFVQGNLVEGRDEGLVRALAGGHRLGNHSWTHPAFSKLTLAEAAAEVERTDALLADLHRRAGVAWTDKLFRFPYLDAGATEAQRRDFQALLKGLGYRTPAAWPGHGADCGCSFDQKEYWLGKDDAPQGWNRPEVLLGLIGPGTPGPGDVVLIHDHEASHGLFFECIDAYQRFGVEFGLP